MQYWIKLFEKSIYFNVIRTTTRLIGILVGLFLLVSHYKPQVVFVMGFGIIVGLDFLLFNILKLQESTYKNKAYFQEHQDISLQNLDRYDQIFNRTRLILFLSALTISLYSKSFFDVADAFVLCWLFFIGFPLSRFIAYKTRYTPLMAIQSFTPHSPSPMSTTVESYYRAPYSDFTVFGTEGFNKAGTYTGIGDNKFL